MKWSSVGSDLRVFTVMAAMWFPSEADTDVDWRVLLKLSVCLSTNSARFASKKKEKVWN